MIVRHIQFPTTNPEYPQYLAVLHDVYVSKLGLFFDRNFELVPEVNFNFRFWPTYTPVDGLHDIDEIARRELAGKQIVELPDGVSHVYAVHYFGHYVFGYLWDTLQPLMKIECKGPDECRLLVNRLSHDVNEIALHFDLFGYDESKRTEVASLTHVPELWYPFVVCYPGRITHENRDWLRNKYIDNNPGFDSTSKFDPVSLYLCRNDSQGNVTRRVTNNGKVESVLKKYGFRVLDGSEPLAEHIRMFRVAHRIVGPYGSMSRICSILRSGMQSTGVLFRSPSRHIVAGSRASMLDRLRAVGDSRGRG